MSWLLPLPSTWPQSPNTSNENGVLSPDATWALELGRSVAASRSVVPSSGR